MKKLKYKNTNCGTTYTFEELKQKVKDHLSIDGEKMIPDNEVLEFVEQYIFPFVEIYLDEEV